MKANPWFLPLFAAVAFSVVYVLPQAGEPAESAARMELPMRMGPWMFEQKSATEAEVGTLGTETKFSKATCYRPRPGEYSADGKIIPDIMDVSIVLSGSDLNTSIHRPERCMPAQGHSIQNSTKVWLDVEGGHRFPAKRLLSVKYISSRETGGEPIALNCVSYYFFVGRNQITHDHIQRTMIDMKDRLVYGTDQRWAYVTATMMYGRLPWMQGREITIEEADQTVAGFLNGFLAGQIDWQRIAE